MELALAPAVDLENPIPGDLRLTGGTFVWLTRLVDQVDQRLRNRFQFFKGEWFLDKRQGTPFYQNILINGPDLKLIRTIFTLLIVTCPGVASLTTLNLTFNGSTRELVLWFEAKLQDGSTFVSSEYPPYILRF